MAENKAPETGEVGGQPFWKGWVVRKATREAFAAEAARQLAEAEAETDRALHEALADAPPWVENLARGFRNDLRSVRAMVVEEIRARGASVRIGAALLLVVVALGAGGTFKARVDTVNQCRASNATRAGFRQVIDTLATTMEGILKAAEASTPPPSESPQQQAAARAFFETNIAQVEAVRATAESKFPARHCGSVLPFG